MDDKDGIWRTIAGRRVFIAKGQSLTEAMAKSKKFTNIKQKLKNQLTESKNDHKQKQLEIIQKTNPMTDNYHTGIRKIEDIKTFAEAMKDKDNLVEAPDYTMEDAKKALEKGEITIYSSKEIKDGVFVTPSKMEAQQYAGNGKVYSKTVKLNEVAWLDNYEGQYASGAIDDTGKDTSFNVNNYKTFEEMVKDKSAITAMKREGISNMKVAKAKYNEIKLNSQTITRIDKDTAVSNIRNKIPQNVRDGWFTNADSNYKTKLNDIIVNNPEIRSSGLAIAYDGYKEYSGRSLNFNEFLETNLTLYRGTRGQSTVSADDETFMSYTYDKSIANKFGKNIETITIKAKDTLGMYQTTGEYEILVPTSKIKKKREGSDTNGNNH